MKGLILTGGRSQRMGRDKAAIDFHDDGKTQAERMRELLAPFCDDVFLSIGHGKTADHPFLADLAPDRGPLAGLEAAFALDSQSEWLVVACDLPLIDSATLTTLVSAGSGTRAFRNRLDSRAEPLCAIYDAASAESSLADWLDDKKRCARHFIESLDPQLIDLPHPHALDNANTPEDVIEIRAHLAGIAVEKTLKCLFFAILQDEMRTPELALTTSATTPAAVYDELRMIHGLSLKRSALCVAINGDFSDWTTPLRDGDEIVFIPPVSGG